MRKSLASVVSIATLVAACGGFGSEDEENQQPPPSSPEDNAKPPPEVPGKPIEGIYVSAKQGKAGATGFPGSPVNTIAEGMGIARDKKLRLIVCAEEYAENIEVIDGVSAYGYYDCSAPLWKRVNKHAMVRAPKSPALVARDIKAPTRLEGFDIIAPDLDTTTAANGEGTSIGVDARNIPAGTFFISDSVLHGGKGAAGSDGAPATAPTSSGTARGNDGIRESFASCPMPAVMNCSNPLLPGVDGPSITCGAEPAPGAGGKGGDGMWFLDRSPNPHPATELRGRPVGAAGTIAENFGTTCGSNPADTCARGANGGAGAEGVSGANGAWRFDANGFVLGDGVQGKSGEPGRGGQGGGSARQWYDEGTGFYTAPPVGITWARSSRGASGGAGGCGGLAGGAGGGGGASIGLLAVDAIVTLERDLVEASNGGRAGAGTLGGPGKVGGAGGVGISGSGSGGDGGSGGFGGWSGHGAPGPSIALAFKGARPNVAPGVEIRPGFGGEGRGQLSNAPLSTQVVPAAAVGAALAEYEIKP